MKRKRKMLKIWKINIWIAVLIFLTYFIVAFGKGGEFFVNDFKSKKAVAGSAITAMIKIFGMPDPPELEGEFKCDEGGFAIIDLNWPIEDDAVSYDVYRDGEELALNLVENFYQDKNVENETSYDYYVVAKGPVGEATSDTINITTKICKPKIIPFIEISTLDGNSVNNSEKSRIKNKRPFFGGTTNIEDASIDIFINGAQEIYGTTDSNKVGFWQWSVDDNLLVGDYIIYVEAKDKIDNSINASSYMFFEIYDDVDDGGDDKNDDVDDGGDDEKRHNKNNKEDKKDGDSLFNQKSEFSPKKEKPFDFDLSLESSFDIKGISMDKEVYRGENLRIQLDFSKINMVNELMDINYTLINPSGEIVFKYSDRMEIKKGDFQVIKEIYLPYDFELGEYDLKISATIKNTTVGHEGHFDLVDRPILKLGSIGYVTYADIVNNLGWMAIISTAFLGFFSILAIWEHHLYKKGHFHITESILKRRGLID